MHDVINSFTLIPDQEIIFKSICTAFIDNSHKLLKIIGMGGTGKSQIINSFKMLFSQCPFLGTLAVVAPTGIAATNIGGSTIHSYFKTNVHKFKATKPLDLPSIKLDTQIRLFSIKLILIDEVYMVSYETFEEIHRRLCSIFSSNKIMGGVSIVCFGDPLQMQPIPPGTPLFVNRNKISIWNSDEWEVAMLTKTIRQNDPKFCQFLKNVRESCCTDQAFSIILQRELQNSLDSFTNPYSSVDQLIQSTQVVTGTKLMNRVVNEMFQCIYSVDPIICKIRSVCRSKLDCSQLEEHNLLLYLKKGDKVMITSNLCTNRGIVNGTRAIVEYIIYNSIDDLNSSKLPSAVILKILNSNLYNNYYNDSLLLITPVREQINSKILEDIKDKLGVPLILSFCLTIHKTQSLTIDRLLVLLDQSTFVRGLFYTAFSRVRDVSNLYCMVTKQLRKIKQLVGGMLPINQIRTKIL